MKTILVNIQNEEVTIFNEKKQTWETCNFYEAGIHNKPYDKDEIEAHLIERESYYTDEEIKVIFE